MTDLSTDVLLRAAELLGEKGWCQGTARDAEGHMCAIGALQAANDEVTQRWQSAEYRRAQDRLQDHLWGDELLTEAHTIPYWNDNPERTAEDVILALKRTAAGE